MAVIDFGPNVAVYVTKFYIKHRWPDTKCSIDILRSYTAMLYVTRINVLAKSGERMTVTFKTYDQDFNTEHYKIPDETIASLMLLLG